MVESHIVAIQSPGGEIHMGDSKLDKENPYIINRLNRTRFIEKYLSKK